MRTRIEARILLLLSVLVFASCTAMAQSQSAPELSVEQQDALDLLKTLARNLKSEPDKLAAGRLQARIADQLWTFDEPFARQTFRWGFDSIAQSPANDLPKEKQAGFVKRKAAAVKDVLHWFGIHDSKQAAAWLTTFENERVKNATDSSGSLRPELFMQIAAQLATADPEVARRIGLAALSGDPIPDGFGTLLFALSRNRRDLSDELFRAAIVTMRRNNFVYDPALIILANYLFTSDGVLHSTGHSEEAELLANYYVDAAWKQSGGDGSPASPSSASFYTTLELRALPIVSQYAPARLPELRGQMTRILSGLNAEQIQRTELLRSTQQHESAVATRNNYSLDEQIERAEREKVPQVRDALFLSLTYRVMRQDTDRALTLAKKISDEKLRALTEDDVYLTKIQQLLWSAESVAQARKLSTQFNNPVFRARVLVQLAARVWSRNKDQAQAIELLSEALTAVTKADDVPDKVAVQLQVVEQFAKFDSIRAFEVLGTAIATLGRVKVEQNQAAVSATSKPPLLTIKNITVINGLEIMTGNNATLDSIDFREVRSLVAQDYMQAKLLASKLDQPLQRANYLTAVAGSVLKPEKTTNSTSAATRN